MLGRIGPVKKYIKLKNIENQSKFVLKFNGVTTSWYRLNIYEGWYLVITVTTWVRVVAANVVVDVFFFSTFFTDSVSSQNSSHAHFWCATVWPLLVGSFADVSVNILSLANNIPVFFQKTSYSSKLTSKTEKKRLHNLKPVRFYDNKHLKLKSFNYWSKHFNK